MPAPYAVFSANDNGKAVRRRRAQLQPPRLIRSISRDLSTDRHCSRRTYSTRCAAFHRGAHRFATARDRRQWTHRHGHPFTLSLGILSTTDFNPSRMTERLTFYENFADHSNKTKRFLFIFLNCIISFNKSRIYVTVEMLVNTKQIKTNIKKKKTSSRLNNRT